MEHAFNILLNRVLSLSNELERERNLRGVAESRNRAPAPQYVNKEEVERLVRSMAEGRVIEAIKSHRSLTGYGLKESKDAVEAVMRKQPA